MISATAVARFGIPGCRNPQTRTPTHYSPRPEWSTGGLPCTLDELSHRSKSAMRGCVGPSGRPPGSLAHPGRSYRAFPLVNNGSQKAAPPQPFASPTGLARLGVQGCRTHRPAPPPDGRRGLTARPAGSLAPSFSQDEGFCRSMGPIRGQRRPERPAIRRPRAIPGARTHRLIGQRWPPQGPLRPAQLPGRHPGAPRGGRPVPLANTRRSCPIGPSGRPAPVL